jgi:hypothetical protein
VKLSVGRSGAGRTGASNPKRHQAILARPFSVIASLTTPIVRSPAFTIPGVAVASPARINPPSSPIVKPLAFSSDSVQPPGQPVAGQARDLCGQVIGPLLTSCTRHDTFQAYGERSIRGALQLWQVIHNDLPTRSLA